MLTDRNGRGRPGRGPPPNELFVSDATVNTHVARILMKLGLRDRVQAVVYAYEHAVVQPSG